MKDTIIFDLDGTLLDTLEGLKNSTNYALSQCGYQQKSLNEIRSFVGNGVSKLIERAIVDGIKNPDFEKCLGIFKENYSLTMHEKTIPYCGIIELLQTLNNQGYKIGVVSNKYDSAVKALCKEYFGNLVQSAVGEKNGIPPKPSPESIFEAIKELNSTIENTVFAGDSEVDIQTAKNAGLPCISVCWGFRDKDFLISNGAEILIDKTEDFLEAIKKVS